jgi:phospholipid/cholesterol/gamma-HCH transport system ATP-binding protein
VAAGLDELILLLKRAFGVTMLVVTHAMESALRIADRLAMLHQGTLIALGPKTQFVAHHHPRVRQFLDREPDVVSKSSAEGFAASFLRWIDHEH